MCKGFSVQKRMLKEEIEKCVICHKKTEYLKSTPIDQRKHYVEGCGQVCENCANEMGIE